MTEVPLPPNTGLTSKPLKIPRVGELIPPVDATDPAIKLPKLDALPVVAMITDERTPLYDG